MTLASEEIQGALSGSIVSNDLHTTQESSIRRPLRRESWSKLADILYAAELAWQYSSIIAVSVHIGVTLTDLIENLSSMQKTLVYVGNGGNGQKTVTNVV